MVDYRCSVMMICPLLLLFFLSLFPFTLAIPIDNAVEGDPEIECGSTAVIVSFNTRNLFEGIIYVMGFYNQTQCRQGGQSAGQRVAGLNLPFNSCNMQRTRSLNPRGVFVRTTVVIQFHPQFITKVDRAFTISCFYMESDKTVSQQLEVSQITTGFQSQVVPMPVCRYEILVSPNGQPVRYAIVGQQVYHKWTCDSETVDTFCMRIYSCYVNDGAGDRVNIIDEAGCALDRYLLRNLEYLTDLMAGQETHVFKYADRAQLFFQCQIAITIKEPGAQCQRPQCPTDTGSAIKGSGSAIVKRAVRSEEQDVGIVDVTAEMASLDAFAGRNDSVLCDPQRSVWTRANKFAVDGDICMSTIGFSMLLAFMSLLLVTALTVVITLCLTRWRK